MSTAASGRKPRHGLRYHPLYGRWLGMIQRCTDPNHVRYAYYGGRGITVCERWRDFPNFLADMGLPPPGHSIERKDGNKGYEPGNCVWATREEQAQNRSNTRNLTHNGKTQHLCAWAKELGINESSLRERLTTWTTEEALSTPRFNKGKSQ